MQELTEIAAYDAPAEPFVDLFERHARERDQAHADAFLDALRGRLVLDIGSGGGDRAASFAGEGCKVLRVDTSAARCLPSRRRNLRVMAGDARTFFWVVKFHGIWANACLPDLVKTEVPAALARLERHLVPGGLLSCSVKEGGGIGAFSDLEFRALLPPHFSTLRFERVDAGGRPVLLTYLLRRGPA